ncbi:LuxR family transcriptional regulator [Thermoactinospora rubra]|uniref:LuxR family transcriptional regulator n=1 Tax=Thermoactinospora rubra TaxID=1088767 RepID=UPI00117F1BAE|nr:LuxR family transcriptional regulator [Thermoactinospora rubra]
MSDVLAAARDAYGRREWSRARELFRQAAGAEQLAADDLLAFSDSAWWSGCFEEAFRLTEAAHGELCRQGRTRQAAMAAMGLAYLSFLRGDEPLGSGWLGRATRLLEGDEDCAEHAYLRYITTVEGGLEAGEPGAVAAQARRIRAEGRRFGDPALVAVSTMAEGRALIKGGMVAEGMALLDEAMVAVRADRLPPDWAGNIYCHAIAACHELVDIDRMRAWTDALERWCDRMQAAVLFAGICRVHRAQLSLVKGELDRAGREAAQVCAELGGIATATVAEALYVQGEVRRIRGDAAGAERHYLRAHELGRDPQPGLALLRLQQGRGDVAMRSIAAALTAEHRGRLRRAPLAAAMVEIAFAAADTAADAAEAMRKASDELTETASLYAGPGLVAMAHQARGAVFLAEGHPAEALAELRQACTAWRRLDAVFHCADARLLLARAYRDLGDLEAADRELAAASRVFGEVRQAGPPAPLTSREVEVLRLVAAGKTNREIAAALVLSEKTVARHLSNIFTKLNCTSRTAAAAYAFDRGLTAQGRRG